jgi:hypothetical protein
MSVVLRRPRNQLPRVYTSTLSRLNRGFRARPNKLRNEAFENQTARHKEDTIGKFLIQLPEFWHFEDSVTRILF